MFYHKFHQLIFTYLNIFNVTICASKPTYSDHCSLINTVLLAAVPGPDPQGEGGQHEEDGGDGEEARPDKVQGGPGDENEKCL